MVGKMSLMLLRSPNRAQKKLAPRRCARSHCCAIVCASVDFPVPACPLSNKIETLSGISHIGRDPSVETRDPSGIAQLYTAARTSARVVPKHPSRPTSASNRASKAYRRPGSSGTRCRCCEYENTKRRMTDELTRAGKRLPESLASSLSIRDD